MTKKTYYVALKKENNEIFIATSKEAIADFLNVHYVTISRWLKASTIHDDNKCSVWQAIPIKKINKRVFNLPRYKY